ncbi:MAG: hypothetical protein B7Z55_07830 [Planctomycetales bacterium 12-60-4]|nr:MAG: hypothetical protein B7Z55_07830 [Planctomycetales bacterium 12-60-4]
MADVWEIGPASTAVGGDESFNVVGDEERLAAAGGAAAGGSILGGVIRLGSAGIGASSGAE